MNLQNFSTNMFYSLQFSFMFEDMHVEDMEEDDPVPDWFIDWWKRYGLSPLVMNPYSLTMLKIPNFSTPSMLRTHVLYKTIKNLVDLSSTHFLNGVRRCGHVRWFVMNHYKCRKILPSTNYEEFHQQTDSELNPFMNLNYLELPDPHDDATWESEKEV